MFRRRASSVCGKQERGPGEIGPSGPSPTTARPGRSELTDGVTVGHPGCLRCGTCCYNYSIDIPSASLVYGSHTIDWAAIKCRWRLGIDPTERPNLLSILFRSFRRLQHSLIPAVGKQHGE